MDKKFKTIEEQIEILKSRNMLIENYDKAHEILRKNNYYYIINGYKELFLDKTAKTEKYVDNTKIEELYELYQFDKKIKINFLKYILIIENEIDTYLAYEFSKTYGHKNYLIPENFNNTKSNSQLVEKFINNVNLEIEHQYKNDNKMIAHYINKYQYIPLWVLIRIISFGKMSKFYSLMKQKEQNEISRKYNLKSRELKIMLHNLTIIRNICAHDEKLYDVKMNSRIFSTKYHKKLKIENKNGNYLYGTRDLFSIVIVLKILLEDKEFYNFYKMLIKDIEQLRKTIITVKSNIILKEMGFPNNYKKLLKI